MQHFTALTRVLLCVGCRPKNQRFVLKDFLTRYVFEIIDEMFKQKNGRPI